MVSQNMLSIYGINQLFRFVEDIWLQRKSRQIGFFFSREKTYFTLYERNMFWTTILCKNHAIISLFLGLGPSYSTIIIPNEQFVGPSTFLVTAKMSFEFLKSLYY